MSFFTAEQLSILSQREVKIAFLVELQFLTDTVYVWNGNTQITSGGQDWKPLYGIGKVEGLGQSAEAQSEQVTLRLIGVPQQDPDILALALEQTPEANQQLVKIYIQLFDSDWQVVGNPILVWFGFMQPPRVSRTETDGEEGQVQEISVTAENAFFNRSRAPYGRNTDRDQQQRYDGDKFFQFVSSLIYKKIVYPDY